MSIPIPSEFIILQGQAAQDRRRRSRSDAALMLTGTAQSTVSTMGRRRNTVGTTAFERPQTSLISITECPPSPSAATDGCLSPRRSKFHLSCSAVSSGMTRACGHRHGIVSRPTSPVQAVDIADTDALYITKGDIKWDEEEGDEKVMLLTPLSPPMTPEHTELSPASSSIMSLPNLSLSAFGLPSSSSLCSDSTSPFTPSIEPAQSPSSSITCLVLDNKKIHLARPKLVKISPSLKSK